MRATADVVALLEDIENGTVQNKAEEVQRLLVVLAAELGRDLTSADVSRVLWPVARTPQKKRGKGSNLAAR